jgi:hypothetical protein
VLVARCLAVKFLPLSRELFVIGCPKTQTASLRIIIVQRKSLLQGPLGPWVNYTLGAAISGQTGISGLSFPGILAFLLHGSSLCLWVHNQIKFKFRVYALQSYLLFPYALS